MTSSTTPASTGAAQLVERIRCAFPGEISKHSLSIPYYLGILFAALLMILLPLVYLTLPVGVSWLAWLHLTHNVAMLGAVRGLWGLLFVGGLYLLPALIAMTLIAFMLRPFFAPREAAPPMVELDPEKQPALATLVELVRAAVGAPPTHRIFLDTQVNASASLGMGLFGIFRRRLDLTIGMPLLSGLTAEQLAGVLAHEFGHFSQRGAMRLTHLVRTMNMWFVHVVYYRDGWDFALQSFAKQTDIRLSWLVHACRGSIWLTRKILWAFMRLGFLASTYLMRRMEFDADTRQIELVGSQSFVATMERIEELTIGEQYAQHQLNLFYRDGKLVDDIGMLIRESTRAMPDEDRRQIEKQMLSNTTSAYDTHPPKEQRLAQALRKAKLGVLKLDLPAEELVMGRESLARHIARHYYTHVLGLQVLDDEILRPTDQLLQSTAATRAAGDAGNRALRGVFHFFAPPLRTECDLRLDDPPTRLDDLRLRLTEVRASVLSVEESLVGAVRELGKALDSLASIEHQRICIDLAVTAGAIASDAAYSRRYQLRQDMDGEFQSVRGCGKHMANLCRPLIERLLLSQTALQLDSLPMGEEERESLCSQWDRLLPALESILRARSAVDRASVLSMMFEMAVAVAQQGHDIQLVVHERVDEAIETVKALRDALGDAPYPFEHSRPGISLRDAIVSSDLPADDPFACFQAGAFGFQGIREIEQRILLDLALIAERVEEALELPRLAEPVVAEQESAKESGDQP